MTFFPSAAAAQEHGYRACKRCRPDASPGSPEWNTRGDLVARAMRLIGDGVIDRNGVAGLAGRLGYSVRQLERQLTAELGAGPLALARAQRAQTARTLIETSDLSLSDVAFAAGFGSIRTFNDTIREVFATTPGELRTSRRSPVITREIGWHRMSVRLPVRTPFSPAAALGHLIGTSIPGVEEWARDDEAGGWWYRRTLALPHGSAVAALQPADDHVAARLWLTDLRDLPVAVSRCRFLLDLDADPVAIDSHLAQDPRLAPLVAAAPGRRVPRTVDGAELAVRIVLGQQISTRAARTHTARLVAAHGTPLPSPVGTLTHVFPDPGTVADIAAGLGLPAARRRTLAALGTALADGTLDLSPGADWEAARVGLAALPGIGPWTVASIAMRALGDPDAFPDSDLGLRHALTDLGVTDTSRWRPWRAYAAQHLWSGLDHDINRIPEGLS